MHTYKKSNYDHCLDSEQSIIWTGSLCLCMYSHTSCGTYIIHLLTSLLSILATHVLVICCEFLHCVYHYFLHQVESANFDLEALTCPAGYVLRPHTTLTGISVCTCNEEIRDIVLCEDDQETVVIRVSVEGGRVGGRDRGRESPRY